MRPCDLHLARYAIILVLAVHFRFGQFQWWFHEEFHDIKCYTTIVVLLVCHIINFCWYDRIITMRERKRNFIVCEMSFILMKPSQHGYLISSLENCTIKPCTEISLRDSNSKKKINWRRVLISSCLVLPTTHFFVLSIILLFDQQMEPPRSLSRSRNFHVNRRKMEK